MISILFVALASLAATEGGPPGAVFEADFRRSQFEPLRWTLVGRNAQRFISPTSRGLRIAFAPKRMPEVPVGIAPTVGIAGDFEITLSYEIVKGSRPSRDPAPGLSLGIIYDSEAQHTYTLMRLSKPKDGEMLFAHRGRLVNGKRKLNFNEEPANSSSGMLRLTRRGKTLVYEACEEPESTFRVIHELPCGDEKIKQIRLHAIPPPSSDSLVVLFRTFGIRATTLIEPEERGARSSGFWWGAIGILVGTTVIIALCATLGRSRAS
ncbi:DUF1583 domain-containing protein [Singulisphaera sp. Ch08]|uniref:DUF1583 domain-containing protein n=1 Tax=Singulisphaera sp. Ch08 TaxID=3120278 RepID=A0AAU7CA69_9BACT